MKIRKENLLLFMFLYIYIPIIIFLCGFVKIYFALPIILIILYILGMIFHNKLLYRLLKIKKENISYRDDYLKIEYIEFIVILFVLILLMWTMGYGGFKEQPIDWYKHNGITMDLIKKSWPVYYINGNEHSMLSYYICGYMLPSLFGKIFNNYYVTYIVTYIYVLLGVFVVYLYILMVLKIQKTKLRIGFIFIFIFILGFQEVGKIILKYVNIDDYNNVLSYFFYNTSMYQYTSPYTLIRWVPYQSIICWIIMLLFFNYKKDIKYYVFIGLPCLMYSAFSFVGIVIFMFIFVIYFLIKNKNILEWIKSVFSPYNILMCLSLGIVLYFYLEGNFLSPKPDYLQFYIRRIDYKYFYFTFFMVLPYYILLYQKYKNELLFHITFIGLFVLPITSMGVFNDFMMRVSIPFLFVETLMVMDLINNYFDKNDNKLFDNIVFENKVFEENYIKKEKTIIICLMITLVCGSITPIKEMVKNIGTEGKEERYDTMQVFANRYGEYAKIGRDALIFNYYAYDIDDKVFYKYIARVKDNKYKKVKGGKIDTKKRVN